MKKVSLRKVVSILLAMCMMLSSFVCTVAFADDEKTVYIASENFTTLNGDGTWDNGVWQAQLHDFNLPGTTEQSTQADFTNNPGEYSSMLYTYSGSYSSTSTGNDHLVGAEIFRAPLFSLDSVEETRDFGVVKTFIAPRFGNITISCDTELKANTAYVFLAYVIKEKIDGTLELVKFIPLNNTANAWADDVTLNIQEGEKLHFEVKRRTSYNQQVASWSSEVTWDPMVTYNKITSDADATIYTSSEYFNTLSGDGTWDNGIWSARVYDMNAKTNTVITDVATYDGKDAYTLDFGTGKSLYIYSGGMTPAQGILTTENATWPEITFTAPKSGKITVSVNGSVDISCDGSGNTTVAYTGYDDGKGTNKVSIGSWGGITNLWGSNDKTFYIQKGETINFRFQPASAEKDLTRWVKIDPKITYEEETTYTPEDKLIYKSSDNFSVANGDGTWDNGVWEAQLHKFVYGENNAEVTTEGELSDAGEYFTVYNSGTNCSDLSTGPESLYSSTYNAYNDHIIGAKGMRPPLLTDASVEGMRDIAVVKTFNVPKAGNVKISRDESVGLQTVGGAYYLIAYVILEKADGTYTLEKFVPLNANNTDAWTNDLNLSVEEGDKIHFEVKRRNKYNDSVSGANLETKWNPIVEYVEVEYVDTRTTFRANEAFSTATADSNWDNVWSAKIYNPAFTDYADGFIDLTAIINDGARYALEQKVPAGNQYIPAYGSAPTVGEGDGGNLMIPSRLTTSTSTTQEIKEAYVAQVFTAPRDGWVTISGTSGNKLSFTASEDETVKMNARIRKIGSTEEIVLKEAVLEVGDTYLNDVYGIYLNSGDKLSFEAKYDKIPEIEGSASGGTLKWGPIVTYIDEPMVRVEEIKFKKSGETVTDFADIASGVVDVSAYIYAKEAFDARAFVAIYDETDALVSCGVSESTTFVAGKTTATAQLSTDDVVTKGSIRLFILKDNLLPMLKTAQTYIK